MHGAILTTIKGMGKINTNTIPLHRSVNAYMKAESQADIAADVSCL